LLVVDPIGNEQTFLSLLDIDQSDERWLALCNLLVRVRSKGLASRLLRELLIKPSILVRDDPHRGFGTGGSNVGCSDGGLSIPSGFPPIVQYELTKVEKQGATVCVVGRHTVFCERIEQRIGQQNTIGIGRCSRREDRNAYRVEYLAGLLNVRDAELNFSATPSFTIEWKNLLQYRRELLRIEKTVRESYSQLLETLLSENYLTSQEAKDLSPSIELIVNDIRKNKSIPLPKP
ncbi:MAG TPA: hypothetical protein VFZ34_15935, partial [Blastocatellia bacterium]|nr:hypothetical protein [Blastocatellia bacterium]